MNLKHLPPIAEVPFNHFTPKKPYTGKVLSSTLLTAAHRAPFTETRHITISTPGLPYIAGQSIGVIVPGIDPRTSKPFAMRLYSVASCGRGDDRQSNTASLVVARHFWSNPVTDQHNIPGVCSSHLCDARPGAPLTLTGPVGKRFILPPDFLDRDFVFIATGTGIAPFRAFLHDLYDWGYEKSRHSCTLILGVPHADSILYDDEFKALAQKHANFTYATAVSRGEEFNPYADLFPTRNNKMYAHVMLWHHRDTIAPAVLRPNAAIYFCGLKGMESGIYDVINHIGNEAGLENLAITMAEDGRMLREVY